MGVLIICSLTKNKKMKDFNKNEGKTISGLVVTKRSSLNLSKAVEGLNSITIGLKWKIVKGTKKCDLDASVFLLNENDVCPGVDHAIFYGNKKPPYGIKMSGDNTTGLNANDDGYAETITISLKSLPDKISKIPIIISIYDCLARQQNFGVVSEASVDILNVERGEKSEICHYDLSGDFSLYHAVKVGEIIKDESGDWIFNKESEGYTSDKFNDSLGTVSLMYGLVE